MRIKSFLTTAALVMIVPFVSLAQEAKIEAYTIDVPDAVLEDLRNRLDNARWPDQLPATSWEYGADLQSMQELAGYWQNEFDWRSAERTLNEFDNYLTEIDGQTVHFIHQKSNNLDAIPLLI